MLRDGAVRETGSHDELMLVPDGAYRRMVDFRAAGATTRFWPRRARDAGQTVFSPEPLNCRDFSRN